MCLIGAPEGKNRKNGEKDNIKREISQEFSRIGERHESLYLGKKNISGSGKINKNNFISKYNR